MISINRHRIETDGRGITTLVAFYGCPLRCKYCLNPKCFSTDGAYNTVSTAELYAALRKKQEEGVIIETDVNILEQCDLMDKNFPFKPDHDICGELSGNETILTGMVDPEQWD